MNRRCSNLALAALLVLFFLAVPQFGNGIRFYKSRQDAFKILGGSNESRLYFSNCDQGTQRASCVFAMDDSFVKVPSQCAMSELEYQPWWLGILDSPAYITTITLLNAQHTLRAFPDALSSVTVMANEEICFRHEGQDSLDRQSFPCDVLSDGILVRSNLEDGIMSLCDVEVLGVPLKFPSVRDADELLEPSLCHQSSVMGNSHCGKAQDKDPSTCAVTAATEEPWVEFMLPNPAIITYVIFRNYKADAKKRTVVRVIVNTRLCKETFEEGAKDDILVIECSYFGNKVRIESDMYEMPHELKLCEIEIYGHGVFLESIEKYAYKGCYSDNIEDHDLPTWASSTSMSVRKCYRMCKRKGFKYFAMQLGKHCYCGDSYGKHGEAPGDTCNVPCKGNEDEACGGKNVNSVYEVTAPTMQAAAGATAEAADGAST